MRPTTAFRRPAKKARAARIRPRVERLEDRTMPSLDVLASFAGYEFGDTVPATGTGIDPPDTILAAGPDHIVEGGNWLTVFDKATGTRVFEQRPRDFFAPVGSPTAGFGDGVVAYDELAGRFVIGALEFITTVAGVQDSLFYFAVSNTSNPLDGFDEMHKFSVRRIIGGVATWADYPRIGWNADAYVLTFNQPPFTGGDSIGVQVLSFDKSTVLDADPATLTTYQVDRPGGLDVHFTMAAATMHGAAPGDPMWFVEEAGLRNGTTLRVVQMTNVLSDTPTFTDFNISVTPYGSSRVASQQGGSGLLETFNPVIIKAAWRDHRLVAAHTVDAGGAARVRWYEFSTSGSSPTLTQSGEINQGPEVNTYWPAIDIAANGDLGLTFMQSSPGEYPSVYVTGRKLTDPLGVMRPPILVKAGEASFDGPEASPHRSGDYSGITVDPVTGASFWAANEYATGATHLRRNWGTWIAHFAVSEPAGAYVTAINPSEVLVAPSLASLTLILNEPMDETSFALADDVLEFTGPGGVDLRTQLTSHSWLSPTQLQVSFNAQTTTGRYRLVLGPQILRASDGAPLDQNSNGQPGEDSGDRYDATFTLNSTYTDVFGYTAWVHLLEAIDLVPGDPGVFTILDNVDNGNVRLDLGANTFNFYGSVYQSFFVGSNGAISFGIGGVTGPANENLTINPTRPAIAPLWDDWRTDLDADDQVLGKFEDLNADGTPDRLILEWNQVQHFPSSRPVTFQAILSLNTGTRASDIVFNYLDLDSGDANTQGAGATVGIKEISTQGPDRLLVSFNQLSPFVGSGQAIRFSAPPVGGEVGGRAFHDLNRNGVQDSGEPGLAGWTLYLDLNNNSLRDSTEPFTLTDASGDYAFTNMVPGGNTIRVERPPGWLPSLVSSNSVLQDFENNRLGAYSVVGATRGSAILQPGGAHDGSVGLVDSAGTDWIIRNDAAVQVAQGDTISVWVRLQTTVSGPAHFGFGATPLGTLSLVIAGDNGQLLLQENLGYAVPGTVLGSASQTYSANTWYRLEVEWHTDDSIIGRLYDSDGTTLLNTVTGSSSLSRAGGIAFRATGSNKNWDTVTVQRTSGDSLTLYVGPRQTATGQDFGVYFDVPPKVESVVLNDGSAQRSRVTSISVIFSDLVALEEDALELRRQDGRLVNVNVFAFELDGKTVALLTFTGSDILGGSLPDGNYRLTIHGERVLDARGRVLDGDDDGASGGNRVDNFFRLYGDSDGDRDVDLLDLARFGSTLGSRAGDARFLSYFDFDGDEDIDLLVDSFQFLRRFGRRLPA